MTLITALDARLGTITCRVSVHMEAWDNIPRRLPVGGRRVRVGWFRSMDPHSLSLTLSHGDPIELLVIPADTTEASARIAMTRAASGEDSAWPTDILAASNAAAQVSTPDVVERDQESAWENEGGRIHAHRPRLAHDPQGTVAAVTLQGDSRILP